MMMEDKGDMALPERWAPIPSAPGYLASSLGQIRRDHARAKPLIGSIDRDGYRRARIGQRTLVCEAFHGPRPEGLECAHLDGNNANNSANNLRWVTHKENVAHSIAQRTFVAFTVSRKRREPDGPYVRGAAFCASDIEKIKNQRLGGASFRAIGKRFGCNASTIYKIVKGVSHVKSGK